MSTVSLQDHFIPLKTDKPSDPSRFKLESPDQIPQFLAALQPPASRNVEVVHLSDRGNISIGKEVAKVIGNAMANCGELKELHMVAAFKGRDIDEVVQCLESLAAGIARSGCRLRLLDLSENALRGTGIRGMAAVLTGRCCYGLQVLRMSDQGLSPEGGRELSAMLSELLANAVADGERVKLRTVKASKNRLENGGALALGNVFATMGSLEEVEMYQCGIQSAGVAGLMRGLAQNKGLRFLDILDNTANGEAEVAIAEAVPNWPKLEDLRLNSCLISSKGMVKILAALQKNCSSLKTLDIGENNIDKKEHQEVLDLLSRMPALQELVLKGNDFFESRTMRNLFEARFREMGKEGVIKARLAGGHTYDDAGSDEEEESGEEDDVVEGEENAAYSVDTNGETPSEGDGDEVDDFLLEQHGEGMWDVTFPSSAADDSDAFAVVDRYGQRLERNNCFKYLGYTVTQLNTMFEAQQYYQVIHRLVVMVGDNIQKLAGEEDHIQRLLADHLLEATLQYTEYLLSYAIMTAGHTFFEEFFRCCGLFGATAPVVLTSKIQLCALAWILRHVLSGNYIPVYALSQIDRELKSPKNTALVASLRNIEGFLTVFGEVQRQSQL
ncbi:ran GTPase-activating protein-like [Paramacrobiotus metropolitanus]|uniref:ran GTPase-activating protein-like n=1 Tax=Paramacrobiotus metropolitanus TaxID=2943436 RepID=UPI002445B2BB|nr:ran GTPase-activating protein-like [Paramacrobiotus metropolitanus]